MYQLWCEICGAVSCVLGMLVCIFWFIRKLINISDDMERK